MVVGVHQTSQLSGPLSIRVDNLHRVVLSQGVALISILIVTSQRALAALSERVVNPLTPPLGVNALLTTVVTGLPPAAPAVDAAVVITPETQRYL